MSFIQHHEQRFISVPFLVPPDSPIRPLIRSWLENLPKTLWELGTKSPQSTQAILDFLLALGLRGAASFDQEYSIVPPDSFEVLASKLGPWFYLDHPSKGGIKGPWARLDQDTQRLGQDVAHVWGQLDNRLNRAVASAIEGNTRAEEYWSSRTLALTH